MKNRCGWSSTDPLYVAYHDVEWGMPEHDDRRLFEFLILEGAQAGLSWFTILKRRENYRRALDGFDPEKIAAYSTTDVQRLLEDSSIIRNRLKIESAIGNARAALKTMDEFGSFDAFIWRYVDHRPIQNAWRSLTEIPATTETSDTMSKDLKKRGFNFVGSTICYSFMQAVGMVNDHVVGCFRYEEVKKASHPRSRRGPARKP
jgi:DNA-3-methyladenine glycosylase I